MNSIAPLLYRRLSVRIVCLMKVRIGPKRCKKWEVLCLLGDCQSHRDREVLLPYTIYTCGNRVIRLWLNQNPNKLLYIQSTCIRATGSLLWAQMLSEEYKHKLCALEADLLFRVVLHRRRQAGRQAGRHARMHARTHAHTHNTVTDAEHEPL